MSDENPDWGKVERLFRMTCGKCKENETISHTTLDGAIEKFCNEKWRVSHTFGYVHKACEQQLPINIKFNESNT